jgi:hypothetical protein
VNRQAVLICLAVLATVAGGFAVLHHHRPPDRATSGPDAFVVPTPTPTATRTATPTPTVTSVRRAPVESGPVRQPQMVRAARAFLTVYLAWQYGHATAHHLPAASGTLKSRLVRQHPRVPAAARRWRVRFRTMQAGARVVVATVHAGRQTYTVSLALTRTDGGWVVSAIAV